MTREEIENALLIKGVVDIGAGDKARIELGTSIGRRLAEVVFDHLRSSTADDLSKNTEFFNALEAAFRKSHDDMELDSETSEEKSGAKEESDLRTWRLKKVETRGFGGLNAASGDVFEFDVAGRDFCIEGQNGSGKSSLVNAILFAMTGKIHRDHYGLWNDPARREPVISVEGTKLGDWPPIAVYPDSWEDGRPPVDVEVTLIFENEIGDEEITAKRRLHGELEALEHDESIDPRLTAVPTLIEGRVAHADADSTHPRTRSG